MEAPASAELVLPEDFLLSDAMVAGRQRHERKVEMLGSREALRDQVMRQFLGRVGRVIGIKAAQDPTRSSLDIELLAAGRQLASSRRNA